MHRSFVAPRTVIGCHGCARAVADAIFGGPEPEIRDKDIPQPEPETAGDHR